MFITYFHKGPSGNEVEAVSVNLNHRDTNHLFIYRVGHEKAARLPFCTCPCYCINFCIYAMLRARATFSWPIL